MSEYIMHPNVVMISDLHVGDPINDRLEDFNRDEDFERLLLEVIPRRTGWPATLIIGGDFIDFAQVLPNLGRHSYGDRFGVTEDESVTKIERVIKGHPRVFSSLERFIDNGGQVLILPGNHDIDLHWPGVFEALQRAIGGAERPNLCFVNSGEIHERGIHIEHGNQYSFDNWFEHWENPIQKAPDGRMRLERPWGTLFLDIIYNDIEDLYPFVNKVYPHHRLAAIALKSFRENERVSVKALARLVAFFLTKGKTFLGGRLLGNEEEFTISDNRTIDTVEKYIKELGYEGEPGRLTEIAVETTALLQIINGQENNLRNEEDEDQEAPLPGLLGLTDDRGMFQRQHHLLTSGKTTIVAFGHTHVPVDGNREFLFHPSDPRRAFNTGSWMPLMPIGELESPLWGTLKARPMIHDIRYLVIEFKDIPEGRLEPLLAPDN
jgi:hypothetical protein